MLKKFEQFIYEKKLHIYTRSFRLVSLVEAGIYPAETVDAWKAQNGYDDYATAIFVSEERIKSPSQFQIRLKEKDIKNKKTFDTEAKSYEGKIMPDSKMEVGGDVVYVYVFDKNCNQDKRARQNHGFKYEGQVIRANNLTKLKYTDKWDAEGTLDRRYLDEKATVDCKTVEIGTAGSMQPLSWETLDEDFKANLHWNIKSMADGTQVEMGDFLRISGYDKSGKYLVKRNIRNEKCFMFCVSFHDNGPDKKVLVEYLVLMPIDVWRTYLPDIDANLADFEAMYEDLKAHKLVGERTASSEAAWAAYCAKYSKLFEKSAVKIRFKRDSKGQLRLQCAISYRNFMDLVLRNRHIKIS